MNLHAGMESMEKELKILWKFYCQKVSIIQISIIQIILNLLV